MNAPAAAGQTARALRHVASRRSLEVLLLQASPLLGAAFGGALRPSATGHLALLLAGSVLLTAHVFAFNDWAGHRADLNDPRRAPRVFARHGVESDAMAALAFALLAAALLVLGALGYRAVLLGAAIAALGLLYSDAEAAGKGVPVVASLLHLLGGALHFLLGYGVGRPLDGRGLAIAVFFGLVFAGGHLNQEVRDRDGDARNGIRTTAVAFGARRALLASVIVFSAAHAELALLALLGVVPRAMLWAAIAWPLQLAASWQALRGEPGFEQACRLQRRYRLLFAFVGLVMVLALATPAAGGESLAGAAAPAARAAHPAKVLP